MPDKLTAPPPPPHETDWDPASPDVHRDQRAAYDAMRERCPVARSAPAQWTVFGHADVGRVIRDHNTFSSVVSTRVAVPNGMDPPEHTLYRDIVDRYFTTALVEAFEDSCREIAAAGIREAVATGRVDLMASLALPFAARVQCAYLGWPIDMHRDLIAWLARNRAAILARDRAALDAAAADLTLMVRQLIDARRSTPTDAPRDLTDALTRETAHGRPLDLDTMVSILRNWTVGEIGTIASSVGIIAEFLARHPAWQDRLRQEPSLLPEAIDEVLRIHGPLVSNRRVTTREVQVGARTLPAGAAVTINWISANRDPRVFEAPDEFRLGRNRDDNLLYGDGIHVCPGAGLARMELRVITEELLRATREIALVADTPPALADPPASGFSSLPVRLTPA